MKMVSSQSLVSIFFLLASCVELIMLWLKSFVKNVKVRGNIHLVNASHDANHIQLHGANHTFSCNNAEKTTKKSRKKLPKLIMPRLLKKRIKKISIEVVNPSLFPDNGKKALIEQQLQKKIEEKWLNFEKRINAEENIGRFRQRSGNFNHVFWATRGIWGHLLPSDTLRCHVNGYRHDSSSDVKGAQEISTKIQ